MQVRTAKSPRRPRLHDADADRRIGLEEIEPSGDTAIIRRDRSGWHSCGTDALRETGITGQQTDAAQAILHLTVENFGVVVGEDPVTQRVADRAAVRAGKNHAPYRRPGQAAAVALRGVVNQVLVRNRNWRQWNRAGGCQDGASRSCQILGTESKLTNVKAGREAFTAARRILIAAEALHAAIEGRRPLYT